MNTKWQYHPLPMPTMVNPILERRAIQKTITGSFHMHDPRPYWLQSGLVLGYYISHNERIPVLESDLSGRMNRFNMLNRARKYFGKPKLRTIYIPTLLILATISYIYMNGLDLMLVSSFMQIRYSVY